MSLSNSLRAFLTVEWVHCSGGKSSSLGQLHGVTDGGRERKRESDSGWLKETKRAIKREREKERKEGKKRGEKEGKKE